MKRVALAGIYLMLVVLSGMGMEMRPQDETGGAARSDKASVSTCAVRLAEVLAVSTSPTIPERPPVDADPDQPADGVDSHRRMCPRAGYVNCMPPISGRAKSICQPEYLQWIKEHCPDVKVVY